MAEAQYRSDTGDGPMTTNRAAAQTKRAENPDAQVVVSGEKPLAPLTPKQKLWVEYYFANGFNATDAARQAGYKGDDKTLAVQGHDNLRKPNVKAVLAKRWNSIVMPPEEILGRLTEIARGTLEDFIDPDTMTVDLRKAKRAAKLHLLKKVEYTITTKTIDATESRPQEDIQIENVKIELHDPVKAKDMLGKYYKMFNDKLIDLNIDLSKMSDEQLDRLRNGEKP